ncbi:putative ABC transporter [Aaosphaeria arxii CBS 175.79]|uniref:Putative ABC transporter n=1 Tax=Aaosphaeria arxii CBS 175.79 TaxID=1450172 RepID=A0A6A5XKC7_9PLEO|nr:putative ABC transporter [Aaosphaeria arxii CBS 175.79]KAF2012754.1 putative ABC transporter [Aaosphaeria arxii CBS 175.79]
MSKWSRDNLQGLTFEYSDLSYTIPRGNVEVLHSMSGIIQQETLHAIMGASGAGKCKFSPVFGGITANLSSYMKSSDILKTTSRKNYIGYVAQNDALLPELTVRETMMHSACVRLPRLLSDAQRSRHVDRIIRCLGWEHVQHNIIGDFESHGLSGGEYKRASIGVELAAAPLALFLDEPTSGLDSTSALTLIRLLRKLTRAGMTIVVILHQPRKEIFNCLDSLTLLHQGRQMYQGSRDNVRSHFERLGHDFAGASNTADLILDIISSEQKTLTSTNEEAKGEESTNDEFRATSRWTRCNNDVSNSGTKFLPLCRASWITQFWLCLVRSLKQQQRRASSFYLEIGVGGIAGLIIGLSLYSYKGQHMQGIYLSPFERLSSSANPNTPAMIGLMVCMAIGLAASPSGVKTFGEENILQCKEASSGHSQSAYYLGKVVSTFPRLAISALHFTSFYTILATPRMTYWENFSIIVLYFYTIYGLASCCSFIVSRQDGPLMAVILCLIVSVLGGYGPSLYVVKQWHLEWLWRMFPGTWASEAYVDRTFRRSAYLYNINGAAQATGFSLGRYHLDISMILFWGRSIES